MPAKGKPWRAVSGNWTAAIGNGADGGTVTFPNGQVRDLNCHPMGALLQHPCKLRGDVLMFAECPFASGPAGRAPRELIASTRGLGSGRMPTSCGTSSRTGGSLALLTLLRDCLLR